LATIASSVLKPYYDRGDGWAASDHETSIRTWVSPQIRPDKGLVLGYSRKIVGKQFEDWGCSGVWVRAGGSGQPNKELVLAVCHEAKGFESDSVFILPWPRKRLIRLVQQEPEIIKVLYVMMTRARKRCFVTREMMAAIELCLETRESQSQKDALTLLTAS